MAGLRRATPACTGGKFKLLPEYLTERGMMAHFEEKEPCNTGTLSYFVLYC